MAFVASSKEKQSVGSDFFWSCGVGRGQNNGGNPLELLIVNSTQRSLLNKQLKEIALRFVFGL